MLGVHQTGRAAALFFGALLFVAQVQGQMQAPVPAQKDGLVDARELRAWIERVQDASRTKNYSGTFVVTSSLGFVTSRLAHMCIGSDVYEQVDLMDGLRRTQLRANNVVHTLYPDQRIATTETRETVDSFPRLLKNEDAKLAEFYEMRALGEDRVAGYATRVVHLKPRDGFRLGMRLWSEEKTGLLLKSQVIGLNGEVLEQVAFSELAINVPSQGEKIKSSIRKLEGYRVEQVRAVVTTAKAEGWRMSARVPGFREVACMKREMRAQPILIEARPEAKPRDVLQWVFSDGLSNVSLFVEPYVRELHNREGLSIVGATHTLTARKGDWWVTVLGEVPALTLQSFTQSLERIQK